MSTLTWLVAARATLLTAGVALAGCSAAPTSGPTGPTGATPLWLLGEVHDNADAHARRLQRLRALLQDGARPALLMEQFDRARQAEIDAVLAQRGALSDDALVERLLALGGAGWDWPLYRPVLQLALQHGLPVVAANVSREELRGVMRQGLAASGFDAAVPADLQQAQAAQIEASHCGQLDKAQAGRMALAQVARDQFMARQLAAQAGRGAVLLAGNGHVRRDLGVPRWLPEALRARVRVVGFIEAGEPTAAAYDEAFSVPPQPRGDPCASLRPVGAAPAPAPPAASAASATGG